jgi:hypothetical protein
VQYTRTAGRWPLSRCAASLVEGRQCLDAPGRADHPFANLVQVDEAAETTGAGHLGDVHHVARSARR